MGKISPISAFPTFQDSIRFMQLSTESNVRTDQCNEVKESNVLNQNNNLSGTSGSAPFIDTEKPKSENEEDNDAIETAIRSGNYASAISVLCSFHSLIYRLFLAKE